jgi:hypothetical protein
MKALRLEVRAQGVQEVRRSPFGLPDVKSWSVFDCLEVDHTRLVAGPAKFLRKTWSAGDAKGSEVTESLEEDP